MCLITTRPTKFVPSTSLMGPVLQHDQPPPVRQHDQPPPLLAVDGSTINDMMTTADSMDISGLVTPPPMSSINYKPPNIKLEYMAAKERVQQKLCDATTLEEVRRALRDANKVRYRCVYCDDYH